MYELILSERLLYSKCFVSNICYLSFPQLFSVTFYHYIASNIVYNLITYPIIVLVNGICCTGNFHIHVFSQIHALSLIEWFTRALGILRNSLILTLLLLVKKFAQQVNSSTELWTQLFWISIQWSFEITLGDCWNSVFYEMVSWVAKCKCQHQSTLRF